MSDEVTTEGERESRYFRYVPRKDLTNNEIIAKYEVTVLSSVYSQDSKLSGA